MSEGGFHLLLVAGQWENDVDDSSFLWLYVSLVNKQASAKAMCQPTENPLMFLTVDNEFHFGSIMCLKPS